MKVYVAGKLSDFEKVILLQTALRIEGAEIHYDWAQQYKDGDKVKDKIAIATEEVQAVRYADLFILYLPGGRGATFEYGLAHSYGVECIIYNPQWEREIGFHKLSKIIYYQDELIKYIKELALRAELNAELN